MRLLGRVTGLLGGGLVLLLTAIFGCARQSPVEAILVRDTGGFYSDAYDYYLFFPAARDVFAVQQGVQQVYYRGQSDGWLYFERVTFGNQAVLFRVRFNGGQRQDILQTESLNQFVWSANRQWIFYRQPNTAGQLELWRVRADGRDAENLTEAHGLDVDFAANSPLLIEAGGWLYFSAMPMTGPFGVYRMRPDGTALEYVTPALTEGARLLALLPDENGLLVECPLSLCTVALDGSAAELLMPVTNANARFREYTVMHTAGLVAARDDQKFRVIRLADKTVLWEREAMFSYTTLVTNDPAEEWLYFVDRIRSDDIETMRRDGASFALTGTAYFLRSWGWTADGEWLVFQAVDEASVRNEIRRLHVATHEVELLHPLIVKTNFAQWSPDRAWIYFVDGQAAQRKRELYRMRPDGSELQAMTAGTPLKGAIYMDTVAGFEMKWRSVGLVGVGILMVGGVMSARHKRRVT